MQTYGCLCFVIVTLNYILKKYCYYQGTEEDIKKILGNLIEI